MEANADSRDSPDVSQNSTENSQDSESTSKKSEEDSTPSIAVAIDQCDVDRCEMDSETMKKMKGDAIGDTLYSERFVLKTLMEVKLQNGAKIEESFEKDLW